MWRALAGSEARTERLSEDAALRGRTYAIAFDRVWNAALALAGSGEKPLRRWSVVEADDERGTIHAEAAGLLRRTPDEVRIRIGLDENGQTRVDAWSRSGTGRADLGRNRRRLKGFFRALDEKLAASPGQILDARRTADFSV